MFQIASRSLSQKDRIETLERDLRRSAEGSAEAAEAAVAGLREELSGAAGELGRAREALREAERERECLLEREKSQKELEQQMISYEKELQVGDDSGRVIAATRFTRSFRCFPGPFLV